MKPGAIPQQPGTTGPAPTSGPARGHLPVRMSVPGRRAITMFAWHAWQRLDAVLSRGARYWIASAVGEALYWLLWNKRATILANMAQVLGPQASPATVRTVARRSLQNYARFLAEFAHLPRWSERELDTLMGPLEGWAGAEAAIREGKGAILVCAHFGNWDVAGWFFGRQYPFAAVAEPLHPPELDALVQGWRRAKHIGIIPLANAARGALKLLSRGGIVALIIDRPTHASGEGVPVQFFGEWTRVPAGAAHFALHTGAPVLVGGIWRTPENTFTGMVRPVLRFHPEGNDRDQDIQRVMQRIVQELECVIRAHPDQWYMFRRMWPRVPDWHQADTRSSVSSASPAGAAKPG